MRPLPPTLRINRRYVLIEIQTGTDTPVPVQKDIYLACSSAVQNLFGDCGAADIRPAVVWSQDRYALVRCTRNTETRMIAALSCVVRAGGVPVRFRTVTVSGTMAAARSRIPVREEKNYHSENRNT